jgi:cytochrome c oxidase subunit 4
MPHLTVLTHQDYTGMRRALQEANIDLCYTVQLARPLYARWSPERLRDAAFRRQIARRRPADPSYRLASVQVDRPGNRLRPDRLIITFHAVSSKQDNAFAHYLKAQYPHREADLQPAPVEIDADHATPKTYIVVALVLALMTAFEVGLLYLPEHMSPPRWALMVVLLLMSALKFGIVASYFMHLRYDHRLYAGFFVAALVVAASTLLALLALFREPSGVYRGVSTSEVPTPMRAATALPGDTQTGTHVFQQQGCGSCHSVAHVPGAKGTLGPRLDGLAQRAGNRIPGVSAEAYIRQSIEAPNAYVVQGYLKLMPSLRGNMTAQEFADLVALLGTL